MGAENVLRFKSIEMGKNGFEELEAPEREGGVTYNGAYSNSHKSEKTRETTYIKYEL